MLRSYNACTTVRGLMIAPATEFIVEKVGLDAEQLTCIAATCILCCHSICIYTGRMQVWCELMLCQHVPDHHMYSLVVFWLPHLWWCAISFFRPVPLFWAWTVVQREVQDALHKVKSAVRQDNDRTGKHLLSMHTLMRSCTHKPDL